MAGTHSSSSSFSCPDHIAAASMANSGRLLINADPITPVSIAIPGQPLVSSDPIAAASMAISGQLLINTDPITPVSIAIPGQPIVSSDPIDAISITKPGQPLATTDPIDTIPSQSLAIKDPVADVSIAIPGQSLAITNGSLSSRRPPPRCWTHEEIIALIDCYGEKWYSLGRSSLGDLHWEEVADAISHRCHVEARKSPSQCRYKMEKLRRRLRSEKKKPQPSWVYFSKMDAMMRGSPNSSYPSPPEVDAEEYGDIGSCRRTTPRANCVGALRFEGPKACGSKFDPSQVDGRGGQLQQSRNHRGGHEGFGGTKPSKLDDSRVDGWDARLGHRTTTSRRNGGFGGTKLSKDKKRDRTTTSRWNGGFGGTKLSKDKKRGRKEEDKCEEEHKNVFGVLASVMEKFTDCYSKMAQKEMEMEKKREKMWMEMKQKNDELFLDCNEKMIESLTNAFLVKKKKRNYGSQ